MSMLPAFHDVSPVRNQRHGARSGAPTHALAGPLDMIGAPMSFPRNGEIYGEGEAADYVYKVIRGTIRTSKVLTDGRRQIGGFYLPGDVFGLESGDEHAFSAEAITASEVLVIRRAALVALAARDIGTARELWALTGCELGRAQEHLMLLVKTAQERVAGFLLEMSARRPAGDTVELPMTRQDIADYLGLTIETVSRTLTSLAHDSAIELPNSRRIVLRNRPALREMNA
jgi:CRP/FNR family transcriptional regulator, nitrogen fixation regulation protein